MTREVSYKLGRYKIIEGTGGGLWWESHSGVGNTKTGRCFIEGNILIIGPSETEKSGFLKTEFMEHLNRLPPWRKTKYYCSSHAIYNCETLRISPEFEGRVRSSKQNNSKGDIISKEGVNRGTTYKLIVRTNATKKVKKKIVWAWGITQELVMQIFTLISKFVINRTR